MRTQLLGTRQLAPLVGCDDTTVRRLIADGWDGGIAMVGPRSAYVVLPDQVDRIVSELRARRTTRSLTGRPPVA